MKTQVNKFENEQALNNKMVLLSLFVFGCILFIVSVIKFSQNAYSFSENSLGYLHETPGNMELVVMHLGNSNEDSDMPEFNFLPTMNAELTVVNRHNLELSKLNENLFKNKQKAYQAMLNALANIEEPELFIEDILSQIKVQTKTMEASDEQASSVEPNVYLNGLYKQKTDIIEAQIHSNKDIEELLVVENESDIELSDWMTEVVDDKELYKVTENKYLTELAARKNAEIFEITDLLWKVKCCKVIEKEEPLVIESWMIDAKCWCPNKKRTEHWNEESFALNNKDK